MDTVTDSKTPKSVRTIVMSAFLRDEMTELAKEVRLAVSYGELSEFL